MPIDNQRVFHPVTSQSQFDKLSNEIVLMIVRELEDIHDLVNLTEVFPDLRTCALVGSTKVPVKSGGSKEQVAESLCASLNLAPCFLLACFSTDIHNWAHAEDNNETTLSEVQSEGPKRVAKTRKAVLYRELVAGELSLLAFALDSLSVKMSLNDFDNVIGQYYFFEFIAAKVQQIETATNLADNEVLPTHEYACAMARFVYFNGIIHHNGKKLLAGISERDHHSTSLLDPAIQAALVQFCILPTTMNRQVARLALSQLYKYLDGELTAARNQDFGQAFKDSTDFATRPKGQKEAFRRKLGLATHLLCFGAGEASLKLAEKGWDKALVLDNQEIRDLLQVMVNTDKRLSNKITRSLFAAPWTMKIEPWEYFEDLGPPSEMDSEYSVASAYLRQERRIARAQKSEEGHTDQGQEGDSDAELQSAFLALLNQQ